MEAVNGNISIHTSSVTPEAVRRLAPRLSPERLKNEREALLAATGDRLTRMREECECLGKIFADSEPEVTATMIAGLDMFTDGFLRLATLIAEMPFSSKCSEVNQTSPVYIE